MDSAFRIHQLLDLVWIRVVRFKLRTTSAILTTNTKATAEAETSTLRHAKLTPIIYTSPTRHLCSAIQQHQLPSRPRAPTPEDSIQVQSASSTHKTSPNQTSLQWSSWQQLGENLRLRLDLNLDVEIQLKVTIRGDSTLALL